MNAHRHTMNAHRHRVTPAFWVALVIVLLAMAVRFHLLDAQSLWHDEGNSYVQTTRSLSDIARHTSHDIHPPGYYWMLAIWVRFTGDTVFALRAFSAFAGVLSVVFTYALGKRLFGHMVGLVAAAIVTLNTFNIYYAQEARMYALLALWSVASMWAFVGFMYGIRRGVPVTLWGVALGVLNAAGLYTQYAFSFVLITQAGLFAAWMTAGALNAESPATYLKHAGRRATQPYMVLTILTLALYLPWLPTAWQQVTTWPNTGHPIPVAEALSQIAAYLAYGITSGRGITLPVAFFLVFGLMTPMRSRKWPVLVPVLWVMVSLGIFLALGLFREANLKLLLPAQIAFALWVGRGAWVLWRIRPRQTDHPVLCAVPKAAAGVGLFALLTGMWQCLDPLYHAPQHQRDNYREIITTVQHDLRPGDAIILAAPNQQEVFDYYYTGDSPVYPLPRGLGGDDPATLAETRDIIAHHTRIFAVLWGLGERDPNNVIESTLSAEAFEAGSAWYGNVRLVRYVTPVDFTIYQQSGVQWENAITLERFALSSADVCPGDVIQVQLIWATAAPLETRYKVFVQLLDANSFLITQHDSEPGGGQHPTVSWQVGETITDNHALIVPDALHKTPYQLIVGVYPVDNPQDRVLLTASGTDYLTLTQIDVMTD